MHSDEKNAIRGTVNCFSVLITFFLALTTACQDNTGPKPAGVDGLPNISGLTVSAPIPAALGGALASVGATSLDESVVYVSLAPGAVPAGLKARIHNVATDQSITTEVVQGGFDPVAIHASIGDTLIVEVRGISADESRAVHIVAPPRPPTVVRSDPPPKKRDVALNAIVVVVFSEPLDSTTVGTESVTLWRGTVSVPGTVRFADDAHLRVEFHPDALLADETDYQLNLSERIRDVNGVSLGSVVSVPFTTGSTTTATNLVFASVSVGWMHSCGVTAEGAAYCWGGTGESGGGSELGSGYRHTALSTTPVPVAGGLTFATVSAGLYHTCGLTRSGAAYCWGVGGQLGDGLGGESATPLPVVGGLTFASLSTGSTSTCGVTLSGAAYCWGNGSSAPVPVPGGLTFATVSTGGPHTCGVTTSGAAYCWGMNTFGELGVGTSTGPEQCDNGNGYLYACSTIPVAVAGGLTFATLSSGAYHTCGLTTSGATYCWGDNYHNLVGGNATGPETCADVFDSEDDGAPYLVPCSRVPAMVADGVKLASLTTGGRDALACGLTSAGVAYCWGNGFGNVGPVAVQGGLTFATMSAGWHFACGVTPTGVAYCWGSNDRGQLGNGTTTYSDVPVKVAGQPAVTQEGASLQRVKVTR